MGDLTRGNKALKRKLEDKQHDANTSTTTSTNAVDNNNNNNNNNNSNNKEEERTERVAIRRRFAAAYAWRDSMARRHDNGVEAILPSSALASIASLPLTRLDVPHLRSCVRDARRHRGGKNTAASLSEHLTLSDAILQSLQSILVLATEQG
ncbi:MAG: hypothetical protein KC550_08105, partial [Nanoarchaeota archaeon]|nr:hypothetical protein [Nanoarchaeota archaeon]